MKRWPYALPVVAAVLFLLPTVLDAHFGLLDDAITILNARAIPREPFSPFVSTAGSGRFFPVYLYYYGFVYLFSGTHATGFYLANLAALCGIVLLLTWTARRWGGSPAQCALTGLVFVVSQPVATTFNTLSKAEVPQCLFLALALAIAATDLHWRTRTVLAAISVLLAVWSKETGYAVVGAAGSAFLAVAVRTKSWRKAISSRQGVFLAATAVGALAAFIAWKLIQPAGIARGSYGAQYQVSLARLTGTAWDLGGYLMRSGAFWIPLLIALPPAWRRVNSFSRTALVEGMLWMGCFLAILLPWPAVFEYQMTPAMMGLALAGGFAIPAFWKLGKGYRFAALAATVVLAFHVVNAMGAASTQRTIDRANAQMVERLASLPRGSQAYLAIPESEYTNEAKLHVQELYGRSDISVTPLPRALPAVPPGQEATIAALRATGLEAPLIRVGFRDTDTYEWMKQLESTLGPEQPRQVMSVVGASEQVADFAFQNLLCHPDLRALSVPCRQRGPIYTERTVSVIWTLYRIPGSGPSVIRNAGRAP